MKKMMDDPNLNSKNTQTNTKKQRKYLKIFNLFNWIAILREKTVEDSKFLCWVCAWVCEVVLRANCFALEPFVEYSKRTQLEQGNKNNRFITNNIVSDFKNNINLKNHKKKS